MIDDPNIFDITRISFDDFITFLFDREYVPIPHTQNEPGPWFWYSTVWFDPALVASHYIRLFQNPGFLRDRFNVGQLEQAFWAIKSGNLDCSVVNLIWDDSLPFDVRENCVRSMELLFAQLFSDCPLDTAVSMWWDSLAYDWACGNRKRTNGGEDAQMQDVMFETLTKILQQPSLVSQGAALHGLGHLHHPGTVEVIAHYLSRNPTLDDDFREFALRAAKFDVM
jgi:hypothetical protein